MDFSKAEIVLFINGKLHRPVVTNPSFTLIEVIFLWICFYSFPKQATVFAPNSPYRHEAWMRGGWLWGVHCNGVCIC